MISKQSLNVRMALSMLVLVGACTLPWEREQPKISFYVLTATSEHQETTPATASREEVSIGIIPGTIPKYLDRGGIVTRASDNEIRVSDLHRWGSPLLTQIETTLAINLRILVPTDRVLVLPFRKALPIQYEISFIIDRFERDADGTVLLDARWSIRGKTDDNDYRLLNVGQRTLSESSIPDEYPAIVAAMSRLLATLSQAIADDVKAFAHQAERGGKPYGRRFQRKRA